MTEFSPVVLAGSNDEVSILKEFAEFWKVPLVSMPQAKESSPVVTYEVGVVDENVTGPLVILPKAIEGAKEISRRLGLKFTVRETLVRMCIVPGTFASCRVNNYQFSGPNLEPVLDDAHNTIIYRVRGSSFHILSIDLISEYRKLLYDSIDEVPNWKFRLVTSMPVSYTLIPASIRNRVFKTKLDLASVAEEAYGPIECLRSIFLASLVIASRNPIPIIRFWRRGKSYALAMSHDVETQVGLEDGANRLIEIEKELGIRSTWNIPSDRYPISAQLLVMLGGNGEVGAHDTRHDGKLLFAKGKAKLERVRRCKERLELLSGREVPGFRAPLLQHSRELVHALGEAGYGYDSSIPSWEPLSPTSLKPHGVGTVFPFAVSDIVEIPVSMPQDHQLIRASGLGVSEAVDYLVKLSKWIKNTGGACVILVHPDYEFSQEKGLEEYRRLLSSFRSDSSCDIMTLGEMARWWVTRQRSYIDDTGKIGTEPSDEGANARGELEVALVTGYGPNGFAIQNPNGDRYD